MKRREFMYASASLAGLALPGEVNADQAKPCPPARISVGGGGAKETICTSPAGTPKFMAGLGDFEVRNLGGPYAPSNGLTTMWDTLPAVWRVLGQPNGADGVFFAWSGGKGDAAGRRLFAHGGGHGDSSNNGLYVYDLNGDERPTGWSIASNSLTDAPPRITPYEPTSGVYPDGTPAAIHSYDQQWYDPALDRFYRFSGSPFSNNGGTGAYAFYYDFAAGRWNAWGGILSGAGSLGGTLIGSPDGQALLCLSGAGGGYFMTPDGKRSDVKTRLWGYDSDANHTAAYDSVNNRWLSVGWGSGAAALWTFKVDWSSIAITDQTNRTGTQESQARYLTGSSEGGSIIFDPDHSQGPCFWVFGFMRHWTTNPMSPQVLRIDANSFAISESTMTGDPIAVARVQGAGGSYNRHVWFPDWRIVATVQSHSAPVSVIKLPS